MAHYHRLADGLDEEADALWDQLNDEQSREVQQHQSRFQATDPRSSRTNHWVILQSMVWNTVARTGAAATSAWYAAKEAWNHPPRSFHNNNNNNHLEDWDVHFGIQDLQLQSTTEPEPTENPNPGYPFVVLRQYPSRFAIQREQDHWGIVANVDVFLQNLYSYYYHRGMVPLICKFLVEFLSLLFTLWLSRILLQKVDWQQLANCKDEHSCRANWSDYYHTTSSESWTHWWLVQGYTALFLAYAAYSLWNFWQALQQAWQCQYIMHEKLGISRRKLQGGAVSWDTVVEQLCRAQESGEYRTSLSHLDPLVIAQRIMRKDNFLIAFWNQRLLDVQIGERQFWCPTLEWSIHLCVVNFMFNHRYELRPAFVLDAAALERRFIVCGIVHALLLPFLMLFVSLHFLFRNVYDFKTQKMYMGNRQWSLVAQWTFREFNELPHAFERRLDPSYTAAEQYLKLFGQSEFLAAVGKLLVFLGGAVGGVLLVLGVISDAILLHVQLWGRNLLWYAGMAGIVYSLGKGLLPTKEAQPSVTRNLFTDMDTALKTVSTHTHYYPEHWKGRGWDNKVYSQFSQLFDSKVKLFLWELISLVLAPYILIAKLSQCAPAICTFCTTIKAKVPGVGDVCGYSTFDFDTYKDDTWDGKTLGQSISPEPTTQPPESLAESILRTGNLEEATRQHPKPRAKDGKMEKSFFGFKSSHPSWKCSPSGQHLVDRVEEYRKAEIIAVARERELYIEAAARQLELLVQMEEKEHMRDPNIQLVPLQSKRIRDIHHDHQDQDHENSEGPMDDADAGTHPSPRLGPMPIQIPSASTSLQDQGTSSPGMTKMTRTTPPAEMFRPANPKDDFPAKVDPSSPSQLPLGQVNPTEFLAPPSLDVFSFSQGSKADTLLRGGNGSVSMELRRLLTTMEPSDGSALTPVSTEGTMDRSRQYYWLDRFHEHLERQEEARRSTSDNGTSASLSPTSQKRSSQSSSYNLSSLTSCAEQNRAGNTKPDDRAASNMV